MVLARQQSYSISAQMIPRTAIFLSLDAINHLNLPHLDLFAGSESLAQRPTTSPWEYGTVLIPPWLEESTALHVWWHLELWKRKL